MLTKIPQTKALPRSRIKIPLKEILFSTNEKLSLILGQPILCAFTNANSIYTPKQMAKHILFSPFRVENIENQS